MLQVYPGDVLDVENQSKLDFSHNVGAIIRENGLMLIFILLRELMDT